MTQASGTANRKHSAVFTELVCVIIERQNRLSLESLGRTPNHHKTEPKVECWVQNQRAAMPCGLSVTDRWLGSGTAHHPPPQTAASALLVGKNSCHSHLPGHFEMLWPLCWWQENLGVTICYEDSPVTTVQGLKQQQFVFYCFWRLEIRDPNVGLLVSPLWTSRPKFPVLINTVSYGLWACSHDLILA